MEKFNGLKITFSNDSWGISSQGERSQVVVSISNGVASVESVYFAALGNDVKEKFNENDAVKSLLLNEHTISAGGQVIISNLEDDYLFWCDYMSHEWSLMEDPLIEGLIDSSGEITKETIHLLLEIFHKAFEKDVF